MALSENDKINRDLPQTSYEKSNNIAVPKGASPELVNKGETNRSIINKLHLIKLANNYPANEKDIPNNRDMFKVQTVSDLCKMDSNAQQYDVDDFYYCKNVGQPINRLITLRRFPYPCTDNIWDKETQGEPDIARMVAYSNQEVNKFEDLLSFSYHMKWKELNAEFEQATMQGDQAGLSGFMKKAMTVIDPNLYKNHLMGENSRMLDPKADQNKVYGPVDSITNTHIRDVGFDYQQDFEITFDYELRSWNGRTPEYAFKDVIANVLACTYNNGKFWPGARFWIGERPSQFYQRYQYLNGTDMDSMLSKGFADLKGVLKTFGTKSSAIDTLKQAMTGGMALAMGKILDKIGRPGILTMNSLLSGEPTGFWHLTIGNPLNPIMCIGNLIIDDVNFTFPTESLSYGDFPTKLQVKVKLKVAQGRDRAGAEMMFNLGKQRLYYAPKTVGVGANKNQIHKNVRGFFGFDKKAIDTALGEAYDFITDGVKSVTETVKATSTPIVDKMGISVDTGDNTNFSAMEANANAVAKG